MTVCLYSYLTYAPCKAHKPYYIVMLVAWLLHILPLSNQRHDCRKKCMQHKSFCFYLQILSETLLVLRIIQRNSIINVRGSSCELPVGLLRFSLNFNFLNRLRKILKYQFSWKFAEWEPSCSMRTERQTDRHTDRRTVGRTGRYDEAQQSLFEILWMRLTKKKKQEIKKYKIIS